MSIALAISACILVICTLITIKNLMSAHEKLRLRDDIISEKEAKQQAFEKELLEKELELIQRDAAHGRSRLYTLPDSPIGIIFFNDELYLISDEHENMLKLEEERIAEHMIQNIVYARAHKSLIKEREGHHEENRHEETNL